MVKFFKDIIESALLSVFIWTGTKLWGFITIYQPDEDILAIHFGKDAQAIKDSLKEFESEAQ